jgi:hypothetical protein
MRDLFRGACVLAMLAAVASCGLLKKKGDADAASDAAAEAAATDTPPADTAAAADGGAAPAIAAPTAANVDDIARFPDETKLENVSATTKRWATVREAPQTGKPVASLNANTTVTQISQRQSYFVVVFDSPKEPGKKLMGWIHQDAFSPVADAGIKMLTCGKGETPLFSDGVFCGRVCQTDGECPPGQACKGSAQKLTKDMKPGDSVTVCTVFAVPDAGGGGGGLPKPKFLTVDAGGGPTPPQPTTPPSTPPTPAGDVVDPTGGACPANFLLVPKDGKCHKLCPKFDCQKATQFCINCSGQKVCSANRDLCK